MIHPVLGDLSDRSPAVWIAVLTMDAIAAGSSMATAQVRERLAHEVEPRVSAPHGRPLPERTDRP